MKQNSLFLALLLATVCSAEASSVALPRGFRESTQTVGNGVSLRYIRGGSGEPVVLVHGFGDTAEMWRPILPQLGRSYTVIAPQLPGLRGSSFLPGNVYDMKTTARYIHELVKRLGFKRIRLVGHDIGMMAVFAYASQYPEEVRKLVLMDAPIPGIGEEWPKIFNDPHLWHFHFPDSPIALKLVKGRERTFLDHFWITFSGNPNAIAIPEADRRFYTLAYAKPGAMEAALGYFKAFPQDAVDNQRFQEAGKLPMPVLVIEGQRAMAGLLTAQAKQAAINVKSVVLKNAGHWLIDERPNEVRSEILGFLRG